MTMKTLAKGIFVLTSAALLGGIACERYLRHREPHEETRKRYTPMTGLGPDKLELARTTDGNYRLLLDAPALERLRASARLETPAFRYALARADEAAQKDLESGYQGFEWADAVASASLAWHATGDARHASTALRYLRALLDDRFAVGDGKGGPNVVRFDSGYGIRTFGAYAALGYDWLRGAPGMDAALRTRILTRLDEWLGWYEKEGYLRDRPTANYYWGYLTTLSFAGLAAAGDSPAGDRFLGRAREELSENALPALREELRGGGWPEGDQYGQYTTLEIALVSRAFAQAGVDVPGKFPWLAETVTEQVHALLPDEKTVYDGGTWGEHPARASGLAMTALSIALEGVNDNRAAEARWMTAHALPPLRREQAWVGLLADRPGAPERSPRAGGTTSLHVPGMGLTFARSSFAPTAVWTSFQAGPRLAEDHQDADQG
ncbi:MAG TPA: alginate lyase family protein, partial [Polyangiaceae bacterium]